jgi:hypothetical protein
MISSGCTSAAKHEMATVPHPAIPSELRPALSVALRALVAGERPDLLTRVTEYGDSSATLIDQPAAIWSHRDSTATSTNDGGWHIVLPLWTTDEAPPTSAWSSPSTPREESTCTTCTCSDRQPKRAV